MGARREAGRWLRGCVCGHGGSPLLVLQTKKGTVCILSRRLFWYWAGVCSPLALLLLLRRLSRGRAPSRKPTAPSTLPTEPMFARQAAIARRSACLLKLARPATDTALIQGDGSVWRDASD